MQTPLAFRVEGNGIRFPEGIEDSAAFIDLAQRALDAKLLRRKYLIFAFGVEFEIEGERVPMMIDRDGWAFIDCKENSRRVREAVLRRILTCRDFREMPRAVAAAE